ncbi:MAG: hypothetical protein LBG94_05765 [Treponema sp.]|jgi:hypothetical protein|nr:hypothetical protein [Treponema sp.]
METVKKIFPGLLLVFLTALPLYAQDSERSSSYIVRTEEGLRIFQRIVFPQIPDTIRYEIEIEKTDEGGSVPIEQITATVNMFEVSLRAGHYRYRYAAINRMGIIEGRSQWVEFEIFESVQPYIDSSNYGLSLNTEDANVVLVVYGSDFFKESEFALIRKNPGFNWTGISLNGRGDVIIPDRVTVENNTADLYFSHTSLEPGVYEIFIRNPGGLWICSEEVNVTAGERIALDPDSVHITQLPEASASRLITEGGFHRVHHSDSNRYNSLGFFLGASMAEPLIVGSFNITVSIWQNLYAEFGFDLGFNSLRENVDGYTSAYPYINVGYFMPFSEKIGLLFGAGGGYLRASYNTNDGSDASTGIAANVYAGIHLVNTFNIIYSLRSDFSSINHKLSLGYVFRFE